ncbi:unnamed protein product [Onchocerca flexuosa]|uniref:COX2_CUA domain-containing protein n=1 Tax=Onchocerca flexuosa TaxID=387005 RepID=A0A183I885_9BILA|nr:unnamed protein product [Onchocerca flexuosa]
MFAVLNMAGGLFFGNPFKLNLKRKDGRMIELVLRMLIVNFSIMVACPGFWLIQYQGRIFCQSELTLKSLDNLSTEEFRLFDVDNHWVMLVDVSVGIYCTSGDIIHSFAVPKCFTKIDALNGYCR